MRRKYRSEWMIMRDILKVALDGATKTRIMREARLSYAQLRRYFPYFVERGLLEEAGARRGRPVYRTSARGRALLEVIELVEKIRLGAPRPSKRA